MVITFLERVGQTIARAGSRVAYRFRIGGAPAARPRETFPGGFNTQMDRKEALLILNFKPSDKPTEDEVMQVHRKMMKLNHPDLGGSPFIASKVNEAKEFLLKESGGRGSGGGSSGGEA